MKRREFITLLGGVAATWPLAARAQQMSVIGVLSAQSQESEAPVLAAWREALSDAGFAVGRNVALDYRYADGHGDRLPALAAELVQRPVSMLLANTTPPAFAAKKRPPLFRSCS